MEKPMVTTGYYINITTDKHDVFIIFNEPNGDPPEKVRNEVEKIVTYYVTNHETLDFNYLELRLEDVVEYGVQVVGK